MEEIEPDDGGPQLRSFFQPGFTQNPHPIYRELRDSYPVLRMPSQHGDGSTMVVVSRHDDIDAALRCPEVFSSAWEPRPEMQFVPLHNDPPEHLRYRRLLDPFFGPREMKRLEGPIRALSNELIDRFVERGSCDFAEEYAVPLPCSVFLELVGLPLTEVDEYLHLKEGMLRGSGEGTSPDDPVRMAAYAEVNQRCAALVADRRRQPGDDFWSYLVTADADGQPLTDDELAGIFRLLIIAGLDTVTDSLTCFYAFLATHDEHRRRLVADPAVIPNAVEEMLRYESPAMYLPRKVLSPTQLSACPIESGDDVMLLIGSANTDERAIPDADVVDFDRLAIRHLAFGGGIHRCLGSHLARLELRISLQEWHRRIPEYRIPDGVELTFASVMRQVEHLPLVFASA
jgi:cytochrome P450